VTLRQRSAKRVSWIGIAALVVSGAAPAQDVRANGERCDRSITADSLTSDEKALVDAGHQVTRFVKQQNGYAIGYVFKVATFDAELVMGVFSSVGEHAGRNGLGEFIVRSDIVTDGNPMTVAYEQRAAWPYTNGKYTLQNTISGSVRDGYILDSELLDAGDSGFSPRWLDAYVRVAPRDDGVFVVACNYMVPRTTRFQGRFNTTASERLTATGANLLAWVQRVSQDSTRSEQYRSRLKTLLGA
jgi:hypothetical protein